MTKNDKQESAVLGSKKIKTSFIGYVEKTINDAISEIKIHDGSPLHQILSDVVFLPEFDCLFTSEGIRIDESCRPDKFLPRNIPKKISLPKALVYIEEELIWGGKISKHFGHFLTEGLSRFWFRKENAEVLCAIEEDAEFLKTIFNEINFNSKNIFSPKKAIKISKITLPSASFRLGREAFKIHSKILNGVAKNILEKIEIKPSPKALYLSRTKLTKENSLRKIINEVELEKALIEKDFVIAYPEKLSIREQIKLVNEHQKIVGVVGSALHLSLFCLNKDAEFFYIADKDFIDRNFLLVDGIKDYKSSFISNLLRENKPNKETWQQNRTVDVKHALKNLKELGLF